MNKLEKTLLYLFFGETVIYIIIGCALFFFAHQISG